MHSQQASAHFLCLSYKAATNCCLRDSCRHKSHELKLCADTRGAAVQTHHSQSTTSLENASDGHKFSPPTREVMQVNVLEAILARQ